MPAPIPITMPDRVVHRHPQKRDAPGRLLVDATDARTEIFDYIESC